MKIKQRNIRWLAVLLESLYLVLPILSIINFVSIAIVLYAEIRPWLTVHMPWMQLWIFLLIFVGVTVIAMCVAWIVLVPSIWALRGQQMFGRETREEGEGDCELGKGETDGG